MIPIFFLFLFLFFSYLFFWGIPVFFSNFYVLFLCQSRCAIVERHKSTLECVWWHKQGQSYFRIFRSPFLIASKETRVRLLPSKMEMARSEKPKEQLLLPALQTLQVHCVQCGLGYVFVFMFIHDLAWRAYEACCGYGHPWTLVSFFPSSSELVVAVLRSVWGEWKSIEWQRGGFVWNPDWFHIDIPDIGIWLQSHWKLDGSLFLQARQGPDCEN